MGVGRHSQRSERAHFYPSSVGCHMCPQGIEKGRSCASHIRQFRPYVFLQSLENIFNICTIFYRRLFSYFCNIIISNPDLVMVSTGMNVSTGTQTDLFGKMDILFGQCLPKIRQNRASLHQCLYPEKWTGTLKKHSYIGP